MVLEMHGAQVIKKKDLKQEQSEGEALDTMEKGRAAGNDRSKAMVLLLPRSEPQTKSVTNCCAICLESYKVGDMVAWSTNKDCNHCFHCNCIADCFLRKSEMIFNKITHPCPFCRKQFLDL